MHAWSEKSLAMVDGRRRAMEDAWILVLGHYRAPRLRRALNTWRLQTPPLGPIVRIVQLAYKRRLRSPFEMLARLARLARYADILRGSRKVVLTQRLHQWKATTESSKRQLAAARLGRAEWYFRRATKLNRFTAWREFAATRSRVRAIMHRAIAIGRARTVNSRGGARSTVEVSQHAALAVAFYHWEESCPHFALSVVELRARRFTYALDGAVRVARDALRAANIADAAAQCAVPSAKSNRVQRLWETAAQWRRFQARIVDARNFRLSAAVAVESVARAVTRRAWGVLRGGVLRRVNSPARRRARARALGLDAAQRRVRASLRPRAKAAAPAAAPPPPHALARLVEAGAALADVAPPDWLELGDALAALVEEGALDV